MTATKRAADRDEPHDDDHYEREPPKRARHNNSNNGNAGNTRNKQQNHEPATNMTYGQRCCFPGIEGSGYHSDEDLEFEDESDAMAYLQSVRQEASGIPHLLVAPKSGPQLPAIKTEQHDGLNYDDDGGGGGEEESIDRSIYTDGQGDARGYYYDGAYTAVPDETTNKHEADGNEEEGEAARNRHDTTQAYFNSLITSFHRLRKNLHTSPPLDLVHQNLPATTHSPHVGLFGPSSRTFSIWTTRLLTTDPHPLQIASMDKGSVFRLLRVVLAGGKFLKSGVEISERTSRWVWALLARLPDRGELDHVEVGHVRELGKRAALLMHSLQQMDLLRQEVGDVEGGGEYGDGEDWEGEEEEEEEEEEMVKQEGDQDPPVENTITTTTTNKIRDNSPPHQPPPPSDPPSNNVNTKTEAQNQPKDAAVVVPEIEDGEIPSTPESVPMDMDPDPNAEENDNNNDPPEADMEAAKARLLAALDAYPSENEDEDDEKESPKQQKEKDENEDENDKKLRARINMRATLNMILTVAGEFYGQRDLLEFRDPFRGI